MPREKPRGEDQMGVRLSQVLNLTSLSLSPSIFPSLSFQVVIPNLHFIAISVSVPLSLFSLIVELLGETCVSFPL